MKRETGYSRGVNDEIIVLYPEYKKSGIDCLELSPGGRDFENLDIKKAAASAAEAGLRINSFHLRFGPFELYDVSATDEAKRVFAVEYQKKHIKEASECGIKLFVLHASGEPIAESDRPARIEASKKSLCELAEYAAAFGSTIAVEDLPRTCLGNCSKELLDLVSVDDRLRVCFDTNHLLGEKISDFVRNVGSKIVTTHISDYNFIDERHWLPGEGDIDWNELFDCLDEIGYNGPILYEVNSLKVGHKIERFRDITPSDIKANHLCLENRVRPVTFEISKQ